MPVLAMRTLPGFFLVYSTNSAQLLGGNLALAMKTDGVISSRATGTTPLK